jgi:small subunit ribosomal protein S8
MSFSSEISDFISRIRVAQSTKDQTVSLRLTNLTLRLSGLFYKHGLIQSFSVLNSRSVLIRLKYNHGFPVLQSITLISLPGRRIFWNLKDLAKVYNKQSLNILYILSTTHGLMTNAECLLGTNLGGEVLLQIRLAG